MTTADVACRLLEIDYSGIEMVLTGWFLPDPNAIRLGRFGMHAALTALLTGQPADLSWPDDQLKAYLKPFRKHPMYDSAKRCIHGCVPGDHEVLTPHGWIRFDQLQDGTPVAQWDDGRVTFVVPSVVTRVEYSGGLVELNGRALALQMTPQHRIPIHRGSSTRVLTVAEAQSLPAAGRIPVRGDYETPEGEVDVWGLRLAAAVQADGNCPWHGQQTIFHFTRKRKIQRLRLILQYLKLAYREEPCSCHHNGRRFIIEGARERIAPWLAITEGRKRFLLAPLLTLPVLARQEFLAEVLLWDGHVGPRLVRREYLTTVRHNAEVVQTLSQLSGMQALLRVHLRPPDRQPLYVVSFNRRMFARLEACTRDVIPYSGMVYCVTVPSSFFLIRWRDRISVTGNSNYGLTTFGMVEQFPSVFPTIKDAEKVLSYYYHLVPGLPVWHRTLREQAKKNGYLGGAPPAHPFGYRHWFWDVYGYQPTDEVTARRWVRDPARKDRIVMLHGRPFKVVWGNDSKRVIAFFPQSTAAGVLKRAELRLFLPESSDYIGDAYFGRTPLRAPIHDSLLMEVPNRAWDRVVETVVRVMQDPIPELPLPAEWSMGSHLRIGVAAKAGKNWAPKTEGNPAGMIDLPTPGLEAGEITPGVESSPGLPWDEADWDDWKALERVVA
jgi:hypothetical protein